MLILFLLRSRQIHGRPEPRWRVIPLEYRRTQKQGKLNQSVSKVKLVKFAMAVAVYSHMRALGRLV